MADCHEIEFVEINDDLPTFSSYQFECRAHSPPKAIFDDDFKWSDVDDDDDGVRSVSDTEVKPAGLKAEAVYSDSSRNGSDNDFNYGGFDRNSSPEPDDVKPDFSETADIKVPIDSNKSKSMKTESESKTRKSSNSLKYNVKDYFELKCNECGVEVDSYKELQKHCLNIHKKRAGYIKCKTCGRAYKSPGYMESHIEYHFNPMAASCRVCKKGFYSNLELIKHKSVHDKRFQCDICKHFFQTKFMVAKHLMLVHTEQERLFKCGTCENKFKTLGSLNVHIKNVHEYVNEQICEICSKKIKSRSGFDKHMRRHSNDPGQMEVCTECGMMVLRSNLREHRERHAEEKMVIRCPICNKRLGSKRSLKNHIKFNHEYDIHKCEICDKEFKRPYHLKEHMATHTGVILYQCRYCPPELHRGFKSSSNLYHHYRKKHAQDFEKDRKHKMRRKQFGTKSCPDNLEIN